jgi:DNA mismatch repair ATPase MutL
MKQLLEKDFGACIRKGFESTGLYPFSLEKALSKLPSEEREVGTGVQQQLLKKLSDLRYNAPATTHARRPTKSEKLPAGAAYTCAAESQDERESQDEGESESEDEPVRPKRTRAGGDSSSSNSSSSDQSSDEEERSVLVQKIVERMKRKRRLFSREQQDDLLPDLGEQEPPQEESAEDTIQAWVYLFCVLVRQIPYHKNNTPPPPTPLPNRSIVPLLYPTYH